jgi:2-aminoethylphosphonate-pyruvate transaminase
MILLTPGPCMTSETVRRAAAMPDMNHRDPDFIEIFRDTKARLLRVYPELNSREWVPFLIGGAGTAAVEAMITSCVEKGPVLLIDSGYYSGRMRAKFKAHEIDYEVFEASSAVDLDDLAKRLGSGFEAVVTTHHETSTGRLHNLGKIGKLCREAGAKLLVDGMSSFGADPVDFAHIGAIATSANKCLHGLPGLSAVLVRRPLADRIKGYRPRSVYLSLPFYDGDSPPLTPPVPILTALRQALIEMGSGGASARGAVYRRRAATLRNGLKQRGFRFAIPEDEMSCTLTTASIPEGWTADRWFQANLHNGFMIYGTKGAMREQWFQVANMGEITDLQLELWLANVDDLIVR